MILILFTCFSAVVAQADNLAPVPPPIQGQEMVAPSDPSSPLMRNSGLPPDSSAPVKVSRTKAIDFEDEVVEGLNKNPLDNLQTVGKRDNSNQNRLYKKKPSFKREIHRTATEMGYTP